MTVESKARIHPQFEQLVERQREVCGQQGQATTSAAARRWMLPEGHQGDLLDPEKMTGDAFARDEINANYLECLNDVENMGTVADTAALKQQIDYVAAAERAFRYRHCTPARAIAHAGARRTGLAVGQALQAVTQQVTDLIRSGSVPEAQNG